MKDDDIFQSMMLLGLANIQWMLAQSINIDEKTRKQKEVIQSQAIEKFNGYYNNVTSFIQGTLHQ